MKIIKKQVEYKWEKSFFKHEMKKFPTWMKNLLLKKNKNEKKGEIKIWLNFKIKMKTNY
jgi:hypothetical protein